MYRYMTNRIYVLLLLLLFVGQVACGGDPISLGISDPDKFKIVQQGDRKNGPDGKLNMPADVDNLRNDIMSDADKSVLKPKVVSSSLGGFQVKDVRLLQSSIVSCMGPNMTKVSASMILPTPGQSSAPDNSPDSAGRIRFLLSGKYKEGDDVIDRERSTLVDSERAARTGTAADNLTDSYLRSLETIGNVVAHNCETNKTECSCTNKEDAMSFLQRCLPGIDPDKEGMEEVAEAFAKTCASGSKGMRSAIASFLSSYAFASAR